MRIGVLLFILNSIVLPSFAQSWKSAYDGGVKAVKMRNWSSAEANLKTAIQNRAEEQASDKSYIPHYYLGLAYNNQNKKAQALIEFETAEKLGLATKDPGAFRVMRFLKEVRIPYELALGMRSDFERELSAIQSSLSQKNPRQATANAVETRKKLTQAEDLLRQALRSSDASTFQKDLMELSKSYSDLSEKLEKLNQQAAALIQDERTVSPQNVRKPEKQPADPRQQIETVTKLPSKEEVDAVRKSNEIKKTVAYLEAALQNKARPEAQRSYTNLASLDPGNKKLSNYRQAINALPTPELEELKRKGVIAFYQGQYQDSASYLEQALPLVMDENREDRVKIFFYLACSNASLGVINSNNDAFLDKARRQFAQVKKINPSFPYDKKNIAPKIIELYLNTPANP